MTDTSRTAWFRGAVVGFHQRLMIPPLRGDFGARKTCKKRIRTISGTNDREGDAVAPVFRPPFGLFGDKRQ